MSCPTGCALLPSSHPCASHRRVRILSTFAEHHQQQLVKCPTLKPSLTHLTLGELTYTDALTSALRSAAPHLASLNLYIDEQLGAVAPSLSRMLTACAPQLTSLTFLHNEFFGMDEIPPSLADAVACCTGLQHLRIGLQHSADGTYNSSVKELARALGALPNLCSLKLWTTYDDLLGTVLGNAQHLTSLNLMVDMGLGGEWLQPLPNLTSLTIKNTRIWQQDMRLLAASCSQLTSLRIKDEDGLMPGLAKCAPGSVPLPAALQELRFTRPLCVRALLALALPPGLTRIHVEELHWLPRGVDISYIDSDDDADPGEPGPGGPAGGGAAQGAEQGPGGGVQLPPPPFCPSFNKVLEAVRLLHGRWDSSNGLMLGCEFKCPASAWPTAGDGHVRLFGALRPLGLRRLELKGLVLAGRDILALVEQLPELEVG